MTLHNGLRSIFLEGLVALVAFVALVFTSCAEPLAPTLDLTPASHTLVSGQQLELTVTRRFPGGEAEDVTMAVSYTTSDRSVAVVSPRGVVSAGTQSGSAIVKAFDSSSDATALASVTVVAASVTSIQISPSPAIVQDRGTTRAFTATARFNNGMTRDVTREVLWSSTDQTVAIVGDTQFDKGIVTALAEGDTTILATDGPSLVQGRSIVFVKGDAPQLKALTVTPNPGSIGVGKQVQFTATGVLSDGSSRELTRNVAWSSSRPDIATVDSVGLVTGVLVGDVTITARGPEPTASILGSAPAKVVP